MILAVDYGSRFVGLAITDQEEKIAVRYGVLDQRQEAALDAVRKVVSQERVQTVLVGVPLALSGNETEQTLVSQEFIKDLSGALGEAVNVTGVDETLTSVEAERQVKWEGGRKEEAHAEAARLMLEDYLKRQR